MVTPEQLAELKTKLLATRAQLERELSVLDKPVNMGDDIDGGDEEADEAEEFSANQGMAISLRGRFGKVNAALDRMEKGTYGVCDACGTPIELELLEADPESELCREDKIKKMQ